MRQSLQFLGSFALLLAACSASDGGAGKGGGLGGGAGGGTGVGGGMPGGAPVGGGGGIAGSGGEIINIGGGTVGGGPSSSDGACAAVEQRAEKSIGGKADIIWVVDNSGSMTAEAAAVQANLNRFSQLISSTGIDVHVVLLSEWPIPALIPGVINLVNGICVDPPLGAPGACAAGGDDSNVPGGYMHWKVMVNSNDALAVIQNTFGPSPGTGWRGMLRPDATKTFVIVTDDEANPPPTVPEFTAWVGAQPEFQGALWRFSGVYCTGGGANCSGTGLNWAALINPTGGVSVDMGNPALDWTPVFTQLADAVVADAKPVDCEWIIPPPPEGQSFDKSAVNVQFTGAAGMQKLYFAEGGAAGCSDQYLGWHYDNDGAPTKVVACPGTCPVLQADLSAKVEVLFGCPTEPPPIE